MSQTPKHYSTFTIYRRLLAYARPYIFHVIGFLILSLLATPLALLTPLPLKIAFDSVIDTQPFPKALGWLFGPDQSLGAILLILAGLVVLFSLLNLLQKLASTLLKTFVGEKLVMSFRSRLFQHVQQLSLSYHDMRGTSDSTYRIQYDAQAIQAIVIDSLIPFVSSVFMLGGVIYVTAGISPRLALVALSVSPVLLLLTAGFRGPLRRRWHEARRLESSAQSVISEVLGAMRVVKAFRREDHEHARFVSESQMGMSARLRVAFQENLYSLMVGLTTAVGTAAVLYIGVTDVRSGALTSGNLLLVMAYLSKLYDPLKTLGNQLATRQKSLVSAERALMLLDEHVEVTERPDARPLARARGEVAFRDVSFGYGEGQEVLRNVSFAVPAGASVGIAGKTGAGKTTLMNLLGRFYDPQAGQILLDGVDLRDYRLADLRNQFSVVLQDSILFSASIEENIAYGRTGATHEQVCAAARAANIHDFIQSLPDGYKTEVGERGMRLSGGERQRISIARAFLRDAPLLILDEPTSAVDMHTESGIMEAMGRLMKGRTTFLIAHRLSTLEKCDIRLNLDGGRAVATRENSAGERTASATIDSPSDRLSETLSV